TTGDNGEECYQVTVTDTGIGLDNKAIQHIFTRFFRDRERHDSYVSGFGIGLDLCMRLVKLHDGTISGRNREDGTQGSVFTVILPLHPADASAQDASDGADAVVKTPLSAGRQNVLTSTLTLPVPEQAMGAKNATRYNIMVVDDDTELRDYIRENLGAAYKVKTYSGVEEARKAIAEKHPDIIITDIKMDGPDGFELLKSVKSNISTNHIPVILLSSSNDSDNRMKGWKSGADGFLSKPFSIDELAGMIFGLISTRQKLRGKYSGSLENSEKIEPPRLKGINDNLMKNIDKYINDRLSEPDLNVDTLSEAIGISRSQLHRRLKEIVGVSPSDYIRNIKLQKACELLRGTDVDVAQVAYSLGFNAQSHFSTQFKKYTGMTPTEYRNRETRMRQNESGDD
ncbi:MAG: helix-turn-helix domain-containing protein, partial [Duncaniella sp.]|nr:helix-turn-helix domain-containing protein [Duncaniella sp.]